MFPFVLLSYIFFPGFVGTGLIPVNRGKMVEKVKASMPVNAVLEEQAAAEAAAEAATEAANQAAADTDVEDGDDDDDRVGARAGGRDGRGAGLPRPAPRRGDSPARRRVDSDDSDDDNEAAAHLRVTPKRLKYVLSIHWPIASPVSILP
jgi:hypothetical protein